MTDGTSRKSAKVEPLRPTRPCPICERPSDRQAYPFCSKRCADLDLGKWLTGAYAIAKVEEDEGLPDAADGQTAHDKACDQD